MTKLFNNTASFVSRNKRPLLYMVAFTLLSSVPSFASSSGTALPWEGPLTTVKDSLTGPVALAISVCALFACGAVLVFGGEMTEFVKRALYAVVAVSFIVGGSSFMTTVFGFSGAVISQVDTVAPQFLHIVTNSSAALHIVGTMAVG